MTIVITESKSTVIPSYSWSNWASYSTCDCTNILRSKYNLHPLQTSNSLTSVATSHSAWMSQNSQLIHQHISKIPYALAENIAYKSNIKYTSELPASFCEQWWLSPPHKQNMLSSVATQCGVGFARDSTGVYWATQLFDNGKDVVDHRGNKMMTGRRLINMPGSSTSPLPSI